MVWFDWIWFDWLWGVVHVVFSLNVVFPMVWKQTFPINLRVGCFVGVSVAPTFPSTIFQVEPPWSVEWSCWRMVPWIRQIDFVKILMNLLTTSAGLIKFLAMFFGNMFIWSEWYELWGGLADSKSHVDVVGKELSTLVISGPATYLEWWEALQHPSWLLQSAEILENFCRICFRWKHHLIAS